MKAVLEFWQDPGTFLARGDIHSRELNEAVKPSNYTDVSYVDLSAAELRDALVDGSLDRIQTFKPMEIIYSVDQSAKLSVELDFYSELKKQIGSRQDGNQNKKLFYEVKKILKAHNIELLEYIINKREVLDDLPQATQQMIQREIREAMKRFPNEKIEQKEVQIAKEEKKIVKEAQKVEGIERKIEKEVASKPLTNFSMKDLNKGIVGAFIGVVAHFGFIYGSVIADKITTIRALMLLIFSYLLIVILMYETGYRDIKEKRLMGFLPKRATFIFITSIIVVMAIFFLFNMVDQKDPVGFFKQVAVTSVLASLGAGTADLLGRH